MGYQRLSDKAKRAIVILAEFEGWKKAELARVFRVTPSRISQIVNDYYGERMKIGIEGPSTRWSGSMVTRKSDLITGALTVIGSVYAALVLARDEDRLRAQVATLKSRLLLTRVLLALSIGAGVVGYLYA